MLADISSVDAIYIVCGRTDMRKSPSVQGMLYINQRFHLEDVIRSKYSSFDAIKKARLEKEKPVVEGFLSWFDQQNPIRGSRMNKAVTYIQNRRFYLTTYLEDGRCSFFNNLSENYLSARKTT